MKKINLIEMQQKLRKNTSQTGWLSRVVCMLMVLFSLGVGQMWGQTYTKENSNSTSSDTQGNVTFTNSGGSGTSTSRFGQSLKFINLGSGKYIQFASTSNNISRIEIKACANAGSSKKSLTINTSSDGSTYSAPSTFSATLDGSSTASVTDVTLTGTNGSDWQTLVVNFNANSTLPKAFRVVRGSNNLSVYSVKIYTAPTALAASSITSSGVTFTVTDGANTNNYDFYYSTSSSLPTSGTSASATVSSSKTKSVTGLNAGTTYYAWVRSTWSSGTIKGDWRPATASVYFTTESGASCSDETGLAYGTGTVNKTYGDAVFTNTLTNTNSLSVTYSSTNTSVATVNSSTGAVTIKAAGTTTIKATWAGDATYCEDEVSYTLNVKPNPGDESGTWDRFGGETITLSVSPSGGSSYTYQWQKWYNDQWNNVSNGTADGATTTGATSATLQITECGPGNSGSYRCVVTSAGQSSETDGIQVKVYVLECYNSGTTVYNFTRDGENQAGSLTIDLAANTNYAFKFHADNDYYGNNGTISTDATNWVCSTSQGNLTIYSGLGGTFTIAMEYSTGGNSSVLGEPEISVTYPRKKIYMACGDWKNDNAKMAVYYWRGEVNDWTDDFMSTYTCDDNVRYTTIPAWAQYLIFGRFNKTKTSTGNWDDIYNQSCNISPSATYDLYTFSGWSDCDGKSSFTNTSSFSETTFTISYNKGTSGTGTKSSETKTCDVAFTLPSSAVFTREGYLQTGWTTSDGGAQTHALGGSYTTNDDQTFYPVWTVQSYNLTWNLAGGTTTSAGTGIASGVSSNTTSSIAFGTALTAPTVTKDNYDFSAWSPSVASTMPAAATTYTATWTAQTHDVSFSLTDAAYSSGTDEGEDVATYGTNYSVTFAATSGYSFPSDITVQIGGVTKTKGTHYTWNASTGTLVVTGSYITGDIAISFAAIDDALHVTYDGGSPTSGSAPEDDNSYDVDDEVTVLGDNSMSKTGYTFRGWSDGTTFFLPGQKFTITDNVTLTAVWDSGSGGGNKILADIDFTDETTTSLVTAGETKTVDGYDVYFKGYTSITNGTGAVSGGNMSTNNYYIAIPLSGINGSISFTVTGANRPQLRYYIREYDALPGSIDNPTSYTDISRPASGSSVTVSDVEVSKSYIVLYLGQSSSNNQIGTLSITTPSASSGYTVTFNKGTGPSTVTDLPDPIVGITSGLKILKPEEEPSAANYIFNGWVTTSGGSTAFDFANTPITTDKTIYAKWTAKTSPGSGTVSGTTSICSGSNTNVTLNTSVSGASYQLYKDNVASGVAKAGTGSALIWSVSAAGVYTVKAVETATHASGDMGGSATISIYTALSKTTDPTSSQNATVGVGCALSGLTYAGNANVAFQWQTCTDATPSSASDITSGSQYSNYNTAAMTFTPASAGTYYFRCVVSDDCGSSFNTSVVTVTAKVAPTIYSLTGEPTAICSDATATLTLSGSDDGVTYKLYKGGVDQSDDKVGDGNEITWTVSAAGSYTVKTVANATYAEATMSGTVTISITTATSITTPPATSPTAHDGVSFTLGSGMEVAGASISYKWYSYTSSGGAGEAVIAGATSATYAVTKSTGTYYYKVEVIGTCGSVKSDMITLTVDNKHRITYDANGGSGAPSGNWKSPGSMTLPSDIPTYSGKVFLGWNTKDDGTGDMYQPGATYTMPSSAVTLYAAWETPCFSFSKGTKGTEPTDGFVMTPENINSSAFKGGATLSGGNMTNTSGATLGINASYGFVMIKSTRELTLTLASGMFQEGTVIELEGYTNSNSTVHTYGFSVSGNATTPLKTATASSYDSFKQRYVVAADDGIEGTSSVVVTMNGDCTGSQTYLSAIYIGGCMSCTTITPSLSYDNTTLYAFGGSPSTATPTVTGNTGNGTVTYSSNATGVATVDSETGVVTAVGSGTARITATIEPNGGYCGGSAYQDITVTAQGIVTQAINVDATTAWGTQANLAFSGSGSSHLSQVAVLANTGYTEQSTDNKAQKRDGRSMSVKFKGSGAATTISENKYFSLQFTVEEGYSLNIGRVIVPVQPVSYPLTAAIRISDTNGTTINPTASSSLSAGAIHDVVFDVSGTPLRGTVTLKVFFYNQNNSGTLNDAGFRWASPLLIYGDFVSDYIFETTGNWSTAANWNWGLLPTENDDVTILVPATVNTKTAVAKSVVINTDAPNTGKLTIANNGVLTVDGTITAIKSGAAAATAVSDVVIDCGETSQGALIFEQPTSGLQTKGTVNIYTKTSRVGGKLQWQYMGYPFNSGTDEDYDGYYINKYSETQGGWIVMRDQGDRTINAWDGLAIAGDGAGGAQLQGTFVPTTGDKELTLTYTAGKGKGKSLIGNSWTAPIQILEMEEEDFGGARAAIYVFNTGRYGSKEVSPSGSWVTLAIDAVKAGVDAGTWTNLTVIPAFQGFQVKTAATEDKTLTLNYDKHVRPATDATAMNEPLRAPARREQGEIRHMRLTVESDVAHQDVFLFEGPEFSEDFDNGWDGDYMGVSGQHAYLYVVSPKLGKLAIAAENSLEGRIVALQSAAEKEYTFTFAGNGMGYYLNDLKTQTSTLIQAGNSYTFNYENGDDYNRFMISVTPFGGMPSGLDEISGKSDKVQKVIYKDHVYIIRGGKIYGVDGTTVK